MDELDNFQSFLKYLGIFSVICSKMDGSWWRVLIERGPLEKEIANHFSILALKTL